MRTIFGWALTAALVASPGAATTYVLPPDGALVDAAEVVAQVTVAAVEPAPLNDPPATDYFVQVERVLKGFVAGGTVVVRVPGGLGPDGVGLKIFGAPEFREGERALLFLTPRRDGTYGVLHLMLGAFYEVEAGGRRAALRALAEAVEVSMSEAGGSLVGLEPLRDFDAFAGWIAARAAGEAAEVDYLLEPPRRPLRAIGEVGPLVEDRCTGLGFMWSEIERGESVPLRLDARDLPGAAGRRALDRARRAWAQASDGAIRFRRAGRSLDAGGLGELDGENSLLFDDPHDTAAGSFGCAAGGVVSLSGLWFESGRGQSCQPASAGRKITVGGRTFLEILGADVVFNEGADCLVTSDARSAVRVMAHELGHMLGLAHGRDPESLMWGELRNGDGRPLVGARERRLLQRLTRAAGRPAAR